MKTIIIYDKCGSMPIENVKSFLYDYESKTLLVYLIKSKVLEFYNIFKIEIINP